MPDESTPDDDAQMPVSPSTDLGDGSTTPGGDAYTVVDDEDADPAPTVDRPSSGINPIWLAVAAIVPALIVGVLIWFVASDGGDDAARTEKNVANVVSVFSSGQGGAISTRYEGVLPGNFPEVPQYPGARVVSSEVQVQGDAAQYLVIYDTDDDRAKVSAYFGEQLKEDPWQIEAGQDSRDSTLNQFTRIDDPDISGLVLVVDTIDADLTTIVTSVQVASGADKAGKTPFVPGDGRALPDGFADAVPSYDGATVIQSAFQKQPAGSQFAVSYITKDSQGDVIDALRSKLSDAGFTATDGDASQSTLDGAERIEFTDAAAGLTGAFTTGRFAEDPSYTRIDVQVQSARTPE